MNTETKHTPRKGRKYGTTFTRIAGRKFYHVWDRDTGKLVWEGKAESARDAINNFYFASAGAA